MYVSKRGSENNLKTLFELILKIVFGINSATAKIIRAEIIV